MFKNKILRLISTPLIATVFLLNCFTYPNAVAEDMPLPAPGVMVPLSPPFDPPMLKGLKIHSDNPFRFDFILDKGDSRIGDEQLKNESTKLIKYFLASLTIPEKDLWVNLSPYEKDRIVPQSFGMTEMGRDLLAEDYILKQITASLIYPESTIGKKFWKRIYEQAQKKFGSTDIPVNTFNKVWIVPQKAVVYENAKAGTAYVVESKLKVMLEQDYLSLAKHEGIQSQKAQIKDVNQLGCQIVREVVIPELNKEVNDDKNFAYLRQVYNSLILATWYKKKIKESILGRVYSNKNKIAGINIEDPKEKEKIYQQYLKAFKKGVYNYIKEDVDPATQETIPRKYFSGGFSLFLDGVLEESDNGMAIKPVLDEKDHAVVVKVIFDQAGAFDLAMNTGSGKAKEHQIREELKGFGFAFHGKHVSWDPNYNQHSDWKPQTQWLPKEGELDIKPMEALPRVAVEGMVYFTQTSHPLFLAVADVDGRRQPIVVKQLLGANEVPYYYAMAFVPGKSKTFYIFTKEEGRGQLSADLIAKRKKVKEFFQLRGIHPPEEYIYTPDGNVVPIDADTFSFDDHRQVPSEEPCKAYLYSQLGGPKFYGLVDPAITASMLFLAKRLVVSQLRRFAPRHEAYLGVLKDFYDHGTFTDGHTSQELVNFYTVCYKDFVVYLDDDQKVRMLMLVAGTLSPKERENLREKNQKSMFEKLLVLALSEIELRREEFRSVRGEFLSAAHVANRDHRKFGSNQYNDDQRLLNYFFMLFNELEMAPEAPAKMATARKLPVQDLGKNVGPMPGITQPGSQPSTSADNSQQDISMKGGIDLTADNLNLQTQNNSGEIKFHLDQAMLHQLQNAPGFVPVIINIQPLKDLSVFLGLNQGP